jgi:hypothetical protein
VGGLSRTKAVRSSTPVALALGLALAGTSCSGRDEKTGAAPQAASGLPSAGLMRAMDDPVPAPSPSALPGGVAGSPTWVPPGTASCPQGRGDANASCARGTSAPLFLAQVDSAIDEVVRRQPELFDLTRTAGERAYLVHSNDQLYLGVAAVLQERGFCAGWDLRELQVRNTAGFSEQYDLVLSNGHLRRGEQSFRATCTPASFPVDAADRFDYVRVGFYSIQCEDGRTPPRNGEKKLPVECTGWVTATPKDEMDADVDARVHGPYITWELQQDGPWVKVEDFPGVDFNKFLRGLDPGRFSLCATVQGRRGCLDGEVVPK